MVVSGGAVSTVQVRVAGEASVLPAWSIARTAKVWLPSARPLYDAGLVQAVKTAPSRLHSKVRLPGSEMSSVPVKMKEAEALLMDEPSAGPLVMEVFGFTVSMIQVKLAAEVSVLPAASVATTVKVWLPSATPV